jgi:hypothetical protein
MSVATVRYRELVQASAAELEAGMRRGRTPDVDALVGREFRGANTAAWMRAARMQQFVKGFERRPDGTLAGYNRRVAQDGLDGRWASPGKRFGFFAVRPVDAADRDNHYLQALLLDYGAGGNPWFDPSRPIRDYLVQLDDDLLLGRAFLALGPLRPSARTYFVLEPLH